jgi:hypothetical protein
MSRSAIRGSVGSPGDLREAIRERLGRLQPCPSYLASMAGASARKSISDYQPG